MQLSKYQDLAMATAVYPLRMQGNIIYPTLGLCGEAGELANKIKKTIRDGREIDGELLMQLIDELGDCLWYITAAATELGMDLDYVADRNLRKLEDRRLRGVIKGEGDNR